MPWIRQLVNLNRFDNKPVSQSSATADDWLTGLLIRLLLEALKSFYRSFPRCNLQALRSFPRSNLQVPNSFPRCFPRSNLQVPNSFPRCFPRCNLQAPNSFPRSNLQVPNSFPRCFPRCNLQAPRSFPRCFPRCILQAPRSQFTTTPRWFQIPRSCFLASDESKFVTGTCLEIDGGKGI